MTSYNITSQSFTFAWICKSLIFGIDSFLQPPSVFTEHQTGREDFGRRIFMLDLCLHFTSNFNWYRYLCIQRYINSAFDNCRIHCIYWLRICKLEWGLSQKRYNIYTPTSLHQFPWHWRDPACILNICPKVLINLTCPAAVQACLMGLFVSATQYLLHRDTNTKGIEAWKMYGCISHACFKNYFLISWAYRLMK